MYKLWLRENPKALTSKERYLWLKCIQYYVGLDSNGDGKPDWTAIIDDRPSQVLYPAKAMDQKINVNSKHIPDDLKIDGNARKEAARYQNELYQKYKVLALDHSDKHSPTVLKNFLLLYKYGLSPEIRRSIKNIKYLYAFSGHDPHGNSAAFHNVAHAISVGGVNSFTGPFDISDKVHLLGALAHEIGHAYIFENLSPEELLRVAKKFGGWTGKTAQSFYDGAFFLPYILTQNTAAPKEFAFYKENSITSQYSMTNIHEWFAEAFAAAILIRLGKANFFGPHWQKLLIKTSEDGTQYWSNYNNLSPSFINWLNSKTKKEVVLKKAGAAGTS